MIFAGDFATKTKIEHRGGAARVQKSYLEVLNNQVPPSLGLMLSFKS